MTSLFSRILLAALLVSSSFPEEVQCSGKDDGKNVAEKSKNDHNYDTSHCTNEGVNGESICSNIDDDDDESGDSEDVYDAEGDEDDELELWEEYFEEFDCEKNVNPLDSTEEFWSEIREIYHNYYEEFDHYLHANKHKNGFYVPYRVQYEENLDTSGDQPYGIFAEDFIPKGTLVYRASIQFAPFNTFDSFARFLDEMISEKSVKCNLLFMAYTYGASDPVYVLLDNGSFMKGTQSSDSHDVENNIGLLCPDENCINNDSYYALKDINQNEEIIFNFPPDLDLQEKGFYMERNFYKNLSFNTPGMAQNTLHPISRIPWWIYDPSLNLEGVRDLFDCENVIYSTQRPIHKDAIWRIIRQHYYQLQQQKDGSYNEEIIAPSSSSLTHESGFQLPYEVKYIEGKGRGIFATEFIPKGTFVYSDEPYTAKFTTKLDFLRFLATLPLDNSMICDVIEWTYAANLSDYYGFPDDEEPDIAIIFVMDEGSFMNDAGDEAWEENIDEEPNIGCPHKKEGKRTKDCVTQLYALNDIQPGEEMTCNYHDFARQYYWDEFSL